MLLKTAIHITFHSDHQSMFISTVNLDFLFFTHLPTLVLCHLCLSESGYCDMYDVVLICSFLHIRDGSSPFPPAQSQLTRQNHHLPRIRTYSHSNLKCCDHLHSSCLLQPDSPSAVSPPQLVTWEGQFCLILKPLIASPYPNLKQCLDCVPTLFANFPFPPPLIGFLGILLQEDFYIQERQRKFIKTAKTGLAVWLSICLA